ncbi:MAG: hypothetical protein QM723_37780 [Myxococcaceae bacterium]
MFSLLLLCREPLPQRSEGWKFDLGPVRIEPAAPTRVTEALATALGVRASEVVHFICPTFSSALVAEGLADLIGRATRGVLIDDSTLAVLEDYEHERPLRPDELTFELSELAVELERGQQREANDWSDVTT